MTGKIIKIIDKIINCTIIIFFLFMILIGGYAFFDSYQIYDDTILGDDIITLAPRDDHKFDLGALQEINPDIEGWIRIFETSIDYPVVHSTNNLDYLNKGYDGEYATGGSIFIDYRNAHNFNDDYTIIYGHNMVTGQMFSGIKKYEQTDYFNRHLYGALYTSDQVYKLEIISLSKVDAYNDNIYNLITYANGKNDEIKALTQDKALLVNQMSDYNKLLLLSTCDSYGSNDRTVLLVGSTPSNNAELESLAQEAKSKTGLSETKNGDSDSIFTKNLQTLIIIIAIIIMFIIASTILIKKFYHQRKNKKHHSD